MYNNLTLMIPVRGHITIGDSVTRTRVKGHSRDEPSAALWNLI